MLFIIFKVVLLLGSIVIPLGAKKANPKFKIDTDTRFAEYAINADGLLERIHRPSMSDVDMNETDQA